MTTPDKTYVYASKERTHAEFLEMIPLVIEKLKAKGLDKYKVSSITCGTGTISIMRENTDEGVPNPFWIASVSSVTSLDLDSREYNNGYRDIMIIVGLLNKSYYGHELVDDETKIELLNTLYECVEEFYAGSLTTLKELFQQHYDAGCRFKLPHKAYVPPESVTQDYYIWQTNRLNRNLLDIFGDSNYSLSDYKDF